MSCPDNHHGEWVTDRWSADREAVARQHAQEDAERDELHRGPHNDLWLGVSAPPRTCTYCGSIHPHDALQLLREGWSVEHTGKSYKCYLEPPKAMKWSPTPPVKCYMDHFTEAQIDILNAS